jgi:PiT family inorganic phosphate transporter
MFSSLCILAAVLAVAFFNGANDVSKGVATLAGSGVSRLRSAVTWGVLWTAAGGVAATFATQGLVKAFTGGGLIPQLPTDSTFLIAVPAAAFAWIAFATRAALPVSTTHAIVGALVGAGFVSVGAGGLNWQPLVQRFLLPLGFSPLLSLSLVLLVFPLLRASMGWLQRYCVCLDRTAAVSAATPAGTFALSGAPQVVAGKTEECDCAPATVARLNPMDALHWLTAGATSFARGLNDTPKILALGLAGGALMKDSPTPAFLLVTVAMAAGGLMAGFRVTNTLARRVTAMTPTEGFAANAVTSLLVIAASGLALPVSTTHVSSGAIIGLGLHRRGEGVNWRTVRDMALAWLVTLPVAGAAAALLCWALRHFA